MSTHPTDLDPTEAPAPLRQAPSYGAPTEHPFDAPAVPFRVTAQPAQRMAIGPSIPHDAYGVPVGRLETETPAEPGGPTGVKELNPLPPIEGWVNPGVLVAVGVTLLVSTGVALFELYKAGLLHL